MKTVALIREAKKRYPFLKDTFIDIDKSSPAYGLSNTAFSPPALEGGGTITLVISELKDKWIHEQPRFLRRFGKVRNFEQFILITFLHEIAHVKQFRERSPKELAVLYRTVDDSKTHDENPLEIEADNWARKELKHWKI